MSLTVQNNNQMAIRDTQAYFPTASEMNEMTSIAKTLATCPYYQKLGPGGILAIYMTAREMGLPPMMCLNGGMYTFSGAVSLSAQLMNMMIVNAGHRIDILKCDENECVLQFWRSDRPKNSNTFIFSYTVKMAETAGLLNKTNWKTNRRDMLFNRCMSGGARKFMPDAIMGAYAHGELPGDDAYVDTIPPSISTIESEPLHNAMPPEDRVSPDDANEIELLLEMATKEDREKVLGYIKDHCKASSVADLKRDAAIKIKERLQQMTNYAQQEAINA